MNPRRRRRYWWLVLILLIVLQPVLPSFPRLDFILLDFYHRQFHTQTPPANEEIVHVHIDDQALETVGRWPWHREKLAWVVDELHAAGSRYIVLDLLLDDAQEPRLTEKANPNPFSVKKELLKVDGDAILAASMREAGNVILPIYFKQGVSPDSAVTPKVFSADTLQKLSNVKVSHEMTQSLPESQLVVPVAPLLHASIALGGVTVDYDKDGRVRHIPLLYRHDQQCFAHLSLVIASHIKFDRAYQMTATGQLNTIRVQPTANDEESALPSDRLTVKGVSLKYHPEDTSELHFPLTWPNGSSDWRLFYQSDNTPTQQLNIGRIVELAQFRHNLRTNQIQIDRAYLEIAKRIRPALVEQYLAWFNRLHVSPPESEQDRIELAEQRPLLQKPVMEALQLMLPQLDTTDLTPEELQLKKDLGKLKQVIERTTEINQTISQRITAEKLALASQVKGRTVIVGWTALGSIADFMPTSLHDKCPGSMIISAATNAMLTNHMLKSNATVGFVTSTLMLIFAFLVAIYLRPVVSLIMILWLQTLYVMLTGWLIFDVGNILFYSAQPMLLGALLWTAIMIYRLFTEQKDKARITRQFSHYLAPSLVKLLVEKPESIVRGHHELSCAFIDIEQFTRIADELGAESTVPLLNAYLRRLTQHLMVRDTYVNKYLGDGILAIWGAPIRSTTYAKDAASAILGCMEAVSTLNREQAQHHTPDLRIRASITTGYMMIDDFGAPPLRTDYTIIGSPVNLAARLEQANKSFGTRILIDQQTHEYIQDEFLTRYIGLVRIAGLHDPHRVYELIAFKHLATEEQKESVRLTESAVEAFAQADFANAQALFRQLEALTESTPLTRLYLKQCKRYLTQDGPESFDGSISITTKAS